ncbi:hypothetical protein [Balneatrix alpica]|uniref:AraC family transcriptional regulator n=1 Tax=Balneatrix alpica TaxID=75684 RepID=A0ABV5ZIT8_9GAMM|nr:hypothetical protein [Balneatrix alpica]
MPLIRYMLGTAAIVALVWLAVWLQPGGAGGEWLSEGGSAEQWLNPTEPKQESAGQWVMPTPPAQSKPANSPAPVTTKPSQPSQDLVSAGWSNIPLVGVSQRIALGDIEQLWYTFNEQKLLHAALKPGESQIFVLYQGFNTDFSKAMVTIGYDRSNLLGTLSTTTQLPAGQYEVVVPATTKASVLASAWGGLSYQRGLKAVIERHQVDYQGNLSGSEMWALYQEQP